MAAPGSQEPYQPWRAERVPRPSDPDWDERASGYPPAAYLPPPPSPTPEQFAPPIFTPPPAAQYAPVSVPYGFPKPKIGRARIVRRYAIAAMVFAVVIAVGVAFRGNRLPFLTDMVDTLLSRDPSPGNSSSAELKAGMCLVNPLRRVVSTKDLRVVDCAEPHDAEVVGTFTMPEGDYPGESRLVEKAIERCPAKIRAYAPNIEVTPLNSGFLGPTAEEWALGDRVVACTVVNLGGQATGTVRH